MTEREREIIAAIDTTDEKRYQLASYLRQRLETLEEDVNWLADHHPQLAQELQETVCSIGIES